MLWYLVSLRSEHLASRVDRISYNVILTFFVLLFQISRRRAAVKKTMDISRASGRLGNWRRRSLSGVRAGRILWRVETSAWPDPSLYWQLMRACWTVSGQEFVHRIHRGDVVGVNWLRRCLTGRMWWSSLKLNEIISLLRPVDLHNFQLSCQSFWAVKCKSYTKKLATIDSQHRNKN